MILCIYDIKEEGNCLRECKVLTVERRREKKMVVGLERLKYIMKTFPSNSLLHTKIHTGFQG